MIDIYRMLVASIQRMFARESPCEFSQHLADAVKCTPHVPFLSSCSGQGAQS